jgi:ABC-2 type transport system ATP-binding protein
MPKPMISVAEVSKAYKISQRAKGLPGQIANLFAPKYKTKQAVDRISFDIQEGEIVGFIGANGAGKSTTIKMLSGILYPDSGTIRAAGRVPYRQRKEYVAGIGVVFGQKTQLSWDLPVRDSFELLKHIYRIPQADYARNLSAFIELLDMESFIDQPARQLSLGQRMRSDIAAALLHSPALVFLDEPTIGLDVVAKERIREFILRINKERGVTVILTSHDLRDIEKTCGRIIIIDQGRKIYEGGVEGVKSAYGAERMLTVEFAQRYEIGPMEGVRVEDREGNKKSFSFRGEDASMKELIRHLLDGYEVIDLTISEPEIETVVKNIYQGKNR